MASITSTGTLGTWTLPSRTGGSPHHVALRDGRLTCDCAAGARGVKCWAAKAVEQHGLPVAASEYAYTQHVTIPAPVSPAPERAQRAARADAFAARIARA